MPRKDSQEYREYMREYMKAKRQGLTGLTQGLEVGASGFEPPTSASQTLRANQTALRPGTLCMINDAPFNGQEKKGWVNKYPPSASQ
jgi:hypothetical protein